MSAVPEVRTEMTTFKGQRVTRPNTKVQRPTPRIASALAQHTSSEVRQEWSAESPRPSWTPSETSQGTAQGYINLYRTMRDQGSNSDYVKQMGAKIGDAIRNRKGKK